MENPYHHPEIKTHKINTDSVRVLIFEIFNIITAGQSLIGDGFEEETCELDTDIPELHKLHYKLAEIELSDKLLKLSIYIRTMDDIFSNYIENKDYIKKRTELEKEEPLGYVFESEKQINLTIRETCNKIIHAFDIRPVYDSDDNRDNSPRWGMTGSIEIQGEKNGKIWVIEVYINKYIEAILHLLNIVDKLEA